MVHPYLNTALLDLLHELHNTDVKLIIGGGYGIYLRAEHIRRTGERTLVTVLPEARSTNDLDLFLRPELLINADKLKPLRFALDKLGYEAVPGVEYYQFIKRGQDGTDAGSIKIDILTGPKSRFNGTDVIADERRARPRPSVGIHAHPTNEALTLEYGLMTVPISGKLGSGNSWEAEVFLPHSYTFLMMKLFAFKDRLHNNNKEFGRYHALDMYTILATTTENEWNQALDFAEQYKEEDCVIEAGDLVTNLFSQNNQMGIIRLKESPYYRSDFQLPEFMSGLQELFPNRLTTG